MTECKYCELVENKKNFIYEDEKLVAVIPEKPITKGHIQIISKEHCDTLQDICDKDAEHLFYAASFAATSLFENMGAQGTNIIANTGSTIKKGGHFHINAIARNPEDGLNFLWQPKQLPEPEMKDIQGKIKDKCDFIGVEKKEKKVVNLDKPVEKLDEAPSKDVEEKETSEEEVKDVPSEEEQVYKKKERDDREKKMEEDKESYLVRQLRRLP